jgi:MoxR-like ATPase
MKIAIHESIDIKPNPEQYILDDGLKRAVETALRFNQPLLLTGEPGTGKTQLAYKVAKDLSDQTNRRFGEKPLRFNTKTTSKASDLFYIYDALGHFQQANLKDASQTKIKNTAEFIELQALGKAIVLANPQLNYVGKFNFEMPAQAMSSVVLIDEVDKAPRDFTNDILNEIEDREFSIKEQDNFKVKMDNQNGQRVLVIMTSNSEKNLPEAFLRRCVFYHIPSPGPARLKEIVKMHLLSSDRIPDETLQKLADTFWELRKKVTRKAPATAEFVAFSRILEVEGVLDQPIDDIKGLFKDNLALLIKTKEDMEAVKSFFDSRTF